MAVARRSFQSLCGARLRCSFDFARFDDWTVVLVVDGNDRVVAFECVQQAMWDRIQTIIEWIADRYEPNIGS